MSLACDATSPSPWTQSASKVEPPLLRGWGPLRTSVKGPATSHVGPHLRARQLGVLQLYAPVVKVFSVSFSPKPGINTSGVKGGAGRREEAPRGLEFATAHRGSLLQTEPSSLIQHKVAAEEILPGQ